MSVHIANEPDQAFFDALDVKSKSAALIRYWMKVRGEEIMPRRSQINPAEIKDILPHIIYLEWEAPDRLVYRLAGTTVVEGFGIELKGHNIFDFGVEGRRDIDIANTRPICDHPCGSVLWLEFPGLYERPRMYEIVYLPVADDEGKPCRILGAIKSREQDYDRYELEGPAPASRYVRFDYFDIGAGTPPQVTDLG